MFEKLLNWTGLIFDDQSLDVLFKVLSFFSLQIKRLEEYKYTCNKYISQWPQNNNSHENPMKSSTNLKKIY